MHLSLLTNTVSCVCISLSFGAPLLNSSSVHKVFVFCLDFRLLPTSLAPCAFWPRGVLVQYMSEPCVEGVKRAIHITSL